MTPAPDLFAATPSSPYERGPHIDAAGRFVHWCQHPGCRHWGSHGRGGNLLEHLRAGKGASPRLLGVWYCAEHARSATP